MLTNPEDITCFVAFFAWIHFACHRILTRTYFTLPTTLVIYSSRSIHSRTPRRNISQYYWTDDW